jgi:hypothetical protein
MADLEVAMATSCSLKSEKTEDQCCQTEDMIPELEKQLVWLRHQLQEERSARQLLEMKYHHLLQQALGRN